MNTQDFGAIKRKVFLAYHRDGILDLAASFVVLGFGVNMLTGNIVFLLTGWMMVMGYAFIKQRVTIPRFGYVRFDSHKKNLTLGIAGLVIGMVILLLVVVFQFFDFGQPASPEMAVLLQRYHMVPLSGLFFGLPLLGAAIFLRLSRYYLYALLSVGLPALGGWLEIETYIPIIALGLTMLTFGAVLLATFLKTYPVKEGADENVG